MRRLATLHYSGAFLLVPVRDYRLMLAVVRAADRWGKSSHNRMVPIIEAITAFNAKPRKS